MAKITASFVLALFVVAILNGYCAEGAETSNQPKKDDDIYKSEKTFGCLFLYKMCLFFQIDCPDYYKLCFPSPPSTPNYPSPNYPSPPSPPNYPPNYPSPPSYGNPPAEGGDSPTAQILP